MEILALVADGGLDDAVLDGLEDDELGVLDGGQAELPGDLGQRDAGVGQIEALQAGPQDVLVQAADNRDITISGEAGLVSGQDFLEQGQVAETDGLGEGQVGTEAGSQFRLGEEAPLGDDAEEQLHEDKQLVRRLHQT